MIGSSVFSEFSKPVPIYKSVMILISACIAVLIIMVSALDSLHHSVFLNNLNNYGTGLYLLNAVFMLAFLLKYFVHSFQSADKEITTQPRERASIIYSLSLNITQVMMIILLLSVVSIVITHFTPGFAHANGAYKLSLSNGSGLGLFLSIILCSLAMTEELQRWVITYSIALVFRSILYSKSKAPMTLQILTGAILSSAIFALSHLGEIPRYNMTIFILTFIIGIILYFSALTTKSILVVLVAHFLYDFVGIYQPIVSMQLSPSSFLLVNLLIVIVFFSISILINPVRCLRRSHKSES